jgi:hypothetical protein
MGRSRPAQAPIPGDGLALLALDRHRSPPGMTGLRRAVALTGIGGLVLVELVFRLAYRRQQLRWRASGAVARWENDFMRGRSRWTGGRQPARRS